jgi:hypothetical protein
MEASPPETLPVVDVITVGTPYCYLYQIQKLDGTVFVRVRSADIKKCQIQRYEYNGVDIEYITTTCEFNVIDIRNKNIVMKARFFSEKCECGAFKTYNISKGQIGHADYCGWKLKHSL